VLCARRRGTNGGIGHDGHGGGCEQLVDVLDEELVDLIDDMKKYFFCRANAWLPRYFRPN
jgi:hypothetical protein